MKVTKAVNLFLDYHRMNSQKKYGPGFWGNFETSFLNESWIP